MERVFSINVFINMPLTCHLAECLREMTYLLVCAIKIKREIVYLAKKTNYLFSFEIAENMTCKLVQKQQCASPSEGFDLLKEYQNF